MTKLLKTVISLLLLTSLLLSVLPAQATEVVNLRPYFEGVETVETRQVPLYIESAEERTQVELLYLNGVEDIPYISVETAALLLRETAAAVDYAGYEITLEKADSMVFFSRENSALAWFDFGENVITFNDPDLFARHPGAVSSLDVVEPMGANEAGEVTLFRATSISYRGGSALSYDLGAYNIFTFWQDGTGYFPLQTFSDVFLSQFPLFALSNGNWVMIASGLTEELTQLCAQTEAHEKSEELACFNYYELCLALDHTYGLMEEHQIDSFLSFFAKTSLVNKLLTREAGDTYAALTDLTCGHFADSHSAPRYKSFWASEGTGEGDPALMTPMFSMLLAQLPFINARNAQYPEGVPGYEEVEDTAYITFDHFTLDYHRDYYSTEITATTADTLELLIYANAQIKRENSPIRNVVLDLSLNGGGSVPAAMFTVSWFLGSSSFNLVNVKTGAQANVSYQFDTNLDHMIGEEDVLSDMFGSLHLYCLIGPTSFSCGNLVPAAFKTSGSVTLIGRTSGGGACSVCVLSTADGNVFQLSSSMRANTVKNGIFYSVDEGVTPDIYIDKIEHLYDRDYLTQLIHELD